MRSVAQCGWFPFGTTPSSLTSFEASPYRARASRFAKPPLLTQEGSCILTAMTRRIFSGLVMAVVVAHAQVTATISGKVEDASGAAAGGAIVTIKNPETGATPTGMTDEMSNYRVICPAARAH